MDFPNTKVCGYICFICFEGVAMLQDFVQHLSVHSHKHLQILGYGPHMFDKRPFKQPAAMRGKPMAIKRPVFEMRALIAEKEVLMENICNSPHPALTALLLTLPVKHTFNGPK